ncbi:hypothetical protein [Sphingobacterium deserti]|uniref:Uncharacterized protein n=1 Tax=Sphingobacterium deserti TaxID=1229276 RepID=A0A0B8T237_9SPHI|nr:hypothetical protein [Sphingobacterium deserti]KGE12833.1 hypothetical protein DI53_3387 [Sphingobacterium deserti]
MKNKKLGDYSLDELRAKRKQTKMILAVSGGILAIAIPALCYAAYSTNNIGLFVIGCGSLATCSSILIYLSQIDKEIKMRV